MTKTQKHVSGPALTISHRIGSKAWWSTTAQPGEPGYVEPVITSETKVTICPSFSEHPRWSNTYTQIP